MKIDIKIEKTDFIEQFAKELKIDVIQNGLDSNLAFSISAIKKDLKFFVNSQPRTRDTPNQTKEEPTEAETGLGQTRVSVPRSEEEIVKFITNNSADLSKYSKAKDFTSLNESNVLFGHKNKGGQNHNRITLRMEIDPSDTVETHYNKAKAFFQKAMFVLPDSAGKLNYYTNPGIDLTQHIKIKCSTLTGLAEGIKPRRGLTPDERFDRDSKNKGYAEWTIKQDAVDEIRNNFTNITSIVEAVKEGNLELANTLAKVVDKNDSLKEIPQQLQKLQNKEDLTPSIESYMTLIDMINTLKFSKKVTESGPTYSLISEVDEVDKESSVYSDVIKNIKSWFSMNEIQWTEILSKKIDRLIGKFNS